MSKIYYLGGSPCSGKSTMAEMISEKYGFQYFKADDFLMDFVLKGANDGNEWLTAISKMTPDQLWLQDPEKLKEDELRTYQNLYPYFAEAIKDLGSNTPIVAEGAAFLPSLMQGEDMQYICIVPTKEFQVKHFSQREWVDDYLADCSDPKTAFSNWMGRDALFALSALEQAKERGFATLVVDGSKTIDENYKIVVEAFGSLLSLP